MKRLYTLAALSGIALLSASNAYALDEIFKKYNCTACHTADTKLVGPTYKDVAAKYKGQKDAEAKLMEKVKKGGSGVWGAVPMPPNANVSDDDLKKMIKLVLATK